MHEPIVVVMGESFDLDAVRRIPATVARILLGRRLVTMRERAGLSANDAAERAGIAKAVLWRMERGDVRCRYRLSAVEHLTGLYGAEGERPLLGCLADATRAWAQTYPKTMSDETMRYLDLEAHACRIDWYAPHLVPDLLRTKEYTAAVAGLVEVHPLRQALLSRKEPPAATVRVVLDEEVLAGEVGASEVMVEQLKHLTEVEALADVSVRVLPADGVIHAGRYTGPFVLLGFPEVAGMGALAEVVYRDAAGPGVTGPAEVAMFRAVFSELCRRGGGSRGG